MYSFLRHQIAPFLEGKISDSTPTGIQILDSLELWLYHAQIYLAIFLGNIVEMPV